MTSPPQRPPLGPPPGPERLAELLEDAVRSVTGPADALDRIRSGIRRRRRVHRAGVVLLAVAVVAGGGTTALALASGHGPSGLASAATAPGQVRSTASVTPAATIVPVGNARTTSSFLLVVRLTQLGTQTVPFAATSVAGMPPHGPVIVGAADAAHDGHAQLFVQVDAGCCTEFWTIFRLVDGRVRQMAMSGQPVRLAVGGSVMNHGGFSCAGPDLAVYAYRPGTTAGTFLATRDTYRRAGATLVFLSQHRTTIQGPPADPALARYSSVSCGNLPSTCPPVSRSPTLVPVTGQRHRVLRAGLTGGIGSGKSEVSKRLAAHGAVIIDADVAARAVVAPGTPGLARVAEAFGAGVLSPDGALDRERLGAIVFGDPASRTTLNAIVHPLVGEWMRAAEQAAVDASRGDVIIVHDVPLLAENRRIGDFALVIVVDVPPALQLERLVSQRGMTADQARARMAAQASREQRLAVADLVIDNSGSLADLDRRVAELWADLTRRVAAR